MSFDFFFSFSRSIFVFIYCFPKCKCSCLFHCQVDGIHSREISVDFKRNLFKRWAASTVMTRNNTIPSECNESEFIPALIPLWDFCNHKNGRLSTDYNPEFNQSICYAMEDFKKDEQVFIFYGPRRNGQFFVYNAFVYEENEFDAYVIQLGISKNDSLKNLRLQLLDKLEITENTAFLIRKGNEPIDRNLLAFLRVFSMGQGQLQEWLDKDIEILFDLQYLFDLEFENKYWNFLLNRLKLLQGIYKTSLEDDQQMIISEKLSNNKEMIVRLRISEKLILRNAEMFIKKRLSNLQKN